jgi:hypothetical protein
LTQQQQLRNAGAKLEGYSNVLAAQAPVVQLLAVSQLLQHGFYFTAIKVCEQGMVATTSMVPTSLTRLQHMLSSGLQ